MISYITIPYHWINIEEIKEIFNIDYPLNYHPKDVVFTYTIVDDYFMYSCDITQPHREWICNSQEEFIEKIKLAKLERLL